ncbi:conjugal transfer protein TraV, partial [Escherichia coli]|nr:conjugal transfer protein TraV [Escherichia coli]EJS4031567.1 conjugal transfer protein TraV [Escherichia coli]EJT6564919.1 conjugal transfer protein TraV [Escherichia coli]EJT7034121.1 conjugal transfer protein TraV [Escherichia coli]HAH8442011.1 conjugal transfer protein TraV [Escherichia coli]
LRPSPNPRVIFASDRRADGEMSGIRLALPGETGTLITTATWQVNVPERPPFDIQHVIHWLLPAPLTALMSDNTWLWPDVPGTPALTAGDWPVMESDTPTLKRVKRRTFTLIDNRNRQGWITRRFQCFPLAPLPESLSHRVPDILYPPKTEKKECKDNLQPHCLHSL